MGSIDGVGRVTVGVGIVMGATLVVLAACAQTPATPVDGPASSASPAGTPSAQTELGTLPEPVAIGEVIGHGTVLDDGEGPRLCLGPVMESFPPQCSGPAVAGWDWSSTDGWEEASGVRWGAFAVQGSWDGEGFAVTQPPISLALYDPAPIDAAPPTPGTTDEATLVDIQSVLDEALGDDLIGSGPVDGRLDATVVFDDGTLQEHVDGVYGPNVVRLSSALLPVATP